MVHNYSRRAIGVIVILAVLCVAFAAPVHAEKVEEILMPASGTDALGRQEEGIHAWCRLGQRLTMTDWEVIAIGYRVWREGNPSGDVIFAIYDAETDEALVRERWGDASDLLEVTDSGYQYVTLDKPVRISGDVRIAVEFTSGNVTDHVRAGYFSGDRVTGEFYTNYFCRGVWHDIGEAEEGSYYIAYINHVKPEKPVVENHNSGGLGVKLHLIVGPIVFAVCGVLLYVNSRKRA